MEKHEISESEKQRFEWARHVATVIDSYPHSKPPKKVEQAIIALLEDLSRMQRVIDPKQEKRV